MSAVLSSCAHTAKEKPAQLRVALPETYPLYEGTARVPDRWWEGFKSEELNKLVQEAISGNRNLSGAIFALGWDRASAIL